MTLQKMDADVKAYSPSQALVADIPYHRSYHMLLEEPFVFEDETVGKCVVFGFYSEHLRMQRNRSTSLDNRPTALLVKKFTATGKIAKQAYYWFERYGRVKNQPMLPRTLWNTFNNLYEQHPASQLRVLHRQQIVNAAVDEYGGYGWRPQDIPDLVYQYLDDTNFCDLLSRARVDREERRARARVEIIDSYARMFLTGSSKFEALCSHAVGTSPIETAEATDTAIASIKSLDLRIESLRSKICRASRLEDMTYEARELRRAESQMCKLIHDNWNQVPKHSVGFLDWTTIRGS